MHASDLVQIRLRCVYTEKCPYISKNVCTSQNMPEPNHIICNSIELKHCSFATNTLYEEGIDFSMLLLYCLVRKRISVTWVYFRTTHNCELKSQLCV